MRKFKSLYIRPIRAQSFVFRAFEIFANAIEWVFFLILKRVARILRFAGAVGLQLELMIFAKSRHLYAVATYLRRISLTWVDIIEDGTFGLLKKRFSQRIVSWTFLGTIIAAQLFFVLGTATNRNARGQALFSTFILLLLFMSFYLLMASRLRPFPSILRAWCLTPSLPRSLPFGIFSVFFSIVIQMAPSYIPKTSIDTVGVTYLQLAIACNLVAISVINMQVFWLFGFVRKSQGVSCHLILGYRRVLFLLILSLSIALIIVAFRVAQAYALQYLYLRGIVVPQLLTFGCPFVVVALTAFIVPSVASRCKMALRVALKCAIQSLWPLMTALIILSIPAIAGSTLLHVLASAIDNKSAAWYVVELVDTIWQTTNTLATNIAVCLMFVAAHDRSQRG